MRVNTGSACLAAAAAPAGAILDIVLKPRFSRCSVEGMSLSRINEVVAASTNERQGRAGMPVSSIYSRFVLRIMPRIIRLHASEMMKMDGV
jgi:hypothetical protein